VRKFLAFLSIGILFLVIILSQFFISAQVSCSSQYGACPENVLSEISPLNGKKLFFVRNGLKKVFSSSYLISAYSLQFRLPNTIQVDVLVKKPLFALKSDSSESYALIDKDGTVLSVEGSSELPTLGVSEDLPKVGQKVSDKDLFALDLIDGLYKMYQIRSGMIQEDTLLVDLPGPVRVIFPLVGADRNILLGSLSLIYSNIQSGENKTLYTEIDMRYKNPVLRQ
jgi:hypothetical protein